jgi:hypothetical protein
MLFPPNALASGPRACFLAEKRLTKVKVSKEEGILEKGHLPVLPFF